MRSDIIKKGLERVPHRALLHATGLSRKDLGRPFIGLATSFRHVLSPGFKRNSRRYYRDGL
jgi:dihydroxy-acid dehydratase